MVMPQQMNLIELQVKQSRHDEQLFLVHALCFCDLALLN